MSPELARYLEANAMLEAAIGDGRPAAVSGAFFAKACELYEKLSDEDVAELKRMRRKSA